MKSQFKKQYPVLMTMTFASLLMLSATPVQAADKSASCKEAAQSTYRVGAPGKGTIRKHDCDRVEFSAFELGSTKQPNMGFEDKDTVKVGKPTYNRRPINR